MFLSLLESSKCNFLCSHVSVRITDWKDDMAWQYNWDDIDSFTYNTYIQHLIMSVTERKPSQCDYDRNGTQRRLTWLTLQSHRQAFHLPERQQTPCWNNGGYFSQQKRKVNGQSKYSRLPFWQAQNSISRQIVLFLSCCLAVNLNLHALVIFI